MLDFKKGQDMKKKITTIIVYYSTIIVEPKYIVVKIEYMTPTLRENGKNHD